jgi:hypothetical protein
LPEKLQLNCNKPKLQIPLELRNRRNDKACGNKDGKSSNYQVLYQETRWKKSDLKSAKY